jgi:hypothetical protein
LAPEIVDTMDPVVEKMIVFERHGTAARLFGTTNVWPSSRTGIFTLKVMTKSYELMAWALGLGEKWALEIIALGGLLGSDREVRPYWHAEETGKLEWTYEDFQLRSRNARFEEIGSFTSYYASKT